MEDRAAPDRSLGSSAASGVLWVAAQNWLVRASGFVTLIVLTHQVSPKAFGVVAAAMTVIPIVQLLSDLGFSTYVLQADDIDQPRLSTAFWASVSAGCLLSITLFAVAPLLADAFNSPELAQVLRVFVLALVPAILAAVPLALLRRAMAFRVVALIDLLAVILAQIVAIVIALRGGGVWALVSQYVVTHWVVALLAWRSARWKPSLYLSPSLFRQMAVFGARVSGFEVIQATRMIVESWIITVMLGPSAMGFLNIARRVVQVAQELIAASLVPVSTVVFARVRDSVDRLTGAYLKALGVVYAVVSPLMILIIVTGPVLVPLLVGSEWGPSVPPAQALAMAGIVTLGAMLDRGLFYGLGRPGAWLAYSVVVDVATVSMTAFTVRWGLVGVAIGFVVVASLATVARWVLVAKLLGLSVAVVARPFFRVLAPTALTLAVGTLLFRAMSGHDWVIIGLVVLSMLTLAVNLALLRLLASPILKSVVDVLPIPERYSKRASKVLRLGPHNA